MRPVELGRHGVLTAERLAMWAGKGLARMDLGLLEYALWVTIGIWAILFVPYPVARAGGFLLIILALLRAFTEKGSPEGQPEAEATPRRRKHIL